ncbi:zf-HC2 domain-containing protein [Streptomyces sp. NPDC051315]|uniref:zf-HC2 domain-containing protein n=1 Tax=Streptomyces sp. NPDC051315 TaxID=3365650 RepID=UPI0037BC228F
MTTTPWHASDDMVARYADRSLPEADAWSLDKHLEHCAGCASRVSRAVREGPAGAVLRDVREAVLEATLRDVREATLRESDLRESDLREAVLREAVLRESAPAAAAPLPSPVPSSPRPSPAPSPTPSPRPSPTPSTSPSPSLSPSPRARLWSSRVSVPLARVRWAAGPAVRGTWPVAVLLVALGAVGLAYGAGVEAARPLLLAVAPVVPVLGVALSYGPHADPLHEITAATPSGGLRLLLTRTAAVLAVSLPLLTLAALLLPASGAPGAAAWLLPGLALTLASLALAGYVGCRAATSVTGAGWLVAVLAPALTSSADAPLTRLTDQLSTCLDGPLAQGAWAGAAALCAAALAVRRSAYDRPVRR